MPTIITTDLEINEAFLPPCRGFASLHCNLLFPAQCYLPAYTRTSMESLGSQR